MAEVNNTWSRISFVSGKVGVNQKPKGTQLLRNAYVSFKNSIHQGNLQLWFAKRFRQPGCL